MVCNICPRKCHVKRSTATGYCHATAMPHISRSALHFWEEPPISGANGSGTVFFAHCNLGCIFCQNHTISQADCAVGKPANANALVEHYFALKEQGAHNINLVTPTIYTPVIAKSIIDAKKQNINLPFVWNSNAYENVDTLKTLDGLIDIYLPDLKFYSPKLSCEYAHAGDYFEIATKAILQMYAQVGNLNLQNGIATSGLLIRHLALPNNADQTRAILTWIDQNITNLTHVSLMRQYTPMHQALNHKHLNRTITNSEYKRCQEFAQSLNFTNVYIQSKESATSSFTPHFDC